MLKRVHHTHHRIHAGTGPWSSDAAYSFGGEGASGFPGSYAPDTLPDRPSARSLPGWQLAGRSVPLTSVQDASAATGLLPEASDPAVGILDPLYDEVLNCDLPTEPGCYGRTPGGRASDMSLEHSFDQTHLGRGNSLSDMRPLFPLSEAQATPPEEGLLLGSAPALPAGDRRTLWQQPLYTAYGSSSGMYDSLFRVEQAAPPATAHVRPPASQRASLPNMSQHPPQVAPGFAQLDTPQERRMFGSFDSSHCSQQPPAHSLQGAARGHALPDVTGATPHLQHLGPLLSSQSAPVRLPSASMAIYCSYAHLVAGLFARLSRSSHETAPLMIVSCAARQRSLDGPLLKRAVPSDAIVAHPERPPGG